MKKFMLMITCLFGLYGCGVEEPATPVSVVPDFIVLEDDKGAVLGRGFAISDTVGAAPDHLFDLNKVLFWRGAKLEILVRDFEQDIVLFRLERKGGEVVNLSDTPPAVGNRLYWFGDRRHTVEIVGIGVSFEAEGKVKKNLIAFDGMIEMGMSGGTLFDETGKVWGMIIGADRSKSRIYAVRSDRILTLFQEFE